MVWENVLLMSARCPRRVGAGNELEDGAAYIREVVGEGSRNFLVVADGVWEPEALTGLRKAGAWVLYTSRRDDLLPGAPVLRLDEILKEEAETVLRRVADLNDDQHLPDAAYDLSRGASMS